MIYAKNAYQIKGKFHKKEKIGDFMSENTMHKRLSKKKWSLAELENLRAYHSQKMTLKHMSLKLNRSITSINKMLERQGIRQKRLIHYQHHMRKKFTNGYQDEKLSIKSTIKTLQEYCKSQVSFEDKWVDMSDIVNLLGDKGYRVCQPQYKNKISEYILNGSRVTPVQLVIEANRMRDQNKMAPLYVNGLTTD